MATGRRAITSKTTNKYNKPNVRINILDEGYFYMMRVFPL